MSIMICTKCEAVIDTDLDEFDFETMMCEDCLNERAEE